MLNKNNFITNSLVNIFLSLSAFLISIFVFELVLRISPLSDRLGWNRVPLLSKRVQKFDLAAKIKVVSLGDSFAEWRSGEGVNMFDYAQKNLSDRGVAILNLGRGGIGVDQYIVIYKKYIRFKPDCVVMCVYLGDDIARYPSYSVLNNIPVFDLVVLPKQKLQSFFRRHSVLSTLIFQFVKEKTRFMRSGVFEKNITVLQKKSNSSDAYIRDRISQIDPKISELAKSDIINPWALATGIVFPNYYKDLFSLRSQDSVIAADSMVTIIKEFHKEQGIKNFLVVLLPESLQVSVDYDYFFKKCGFNLEDFPLQKRRKLIKYIETRLNKSGIKTLDTTSELEKGSGMYINFDTHLNKKGHKIVGELISEFIKNNFLSTQ